MLMVNLLLFLFNLVPIVSLEGSYLFRSLLAAWKQSPFDAVHDFEAFESRIIQNQLLGEDGIDASRFPHGIRHHPSLDSNILLISLNNTWLRDSIISFWACRFQLS